MSALTTIVAAFALALVVAALMWGGAGLVIALPVAFAAIGIAVMLDVNRRRKSAATMHDQRERARTQKADFTERDKQTLVSE